MKEFLDNTKMEFQQNNHARISFPKFIEVKIYPILIKAKLNDNTIKNVKIKRI